MQQRINTRRPVERGAILFRPSIITIPNGYSMITVLGPIKYQTCTLSGFPFVCVEPKTFHRANIRAGQSYKPLFFPSDGRVSGITGLLADGNSAQASPVSGAITYIFDERQPIERDAHYYRTFFLPSRVKQNVKLFRNQYFDSSSKDFLALSNNFSQKYTIRQTSLHDNT